MGGETLKLQLLVAYPTLVSRAMKTTVWNPGAYASVGVCVKVLLPTVYASGTTVPSTVIVALNEVLGDTSVALMAAGDAGSIEFAAGAWVPTVVPVT